MFRLKYLSTIHNIFYNTYLSSLITIFNYSIILIITSEHTDSTVTVYLHFLIFKKFKINKKFIIFKIIVKYKIKKIYKKKF